MSLRLGAFIDAAARRAGAGKLSDAAPRHGAGNREARGKAAKQRADCGKPVSVTRRHRGFRAQ